MENNAITMEERAQVIGLKLAFLIDGLNLPLEQKEAFFDALELFSSKELEKLAHSLETIYLNEKTKNIDENFAKAIQKIKAEDDKESAKLLQKTFKEMKGISAKYAGKSKK